MSRREIEERIIELEKREFYSETGLDQLRPRGKLVFSEVGRYREVLQHIQAYRNCMQEMRRGNVPEQEALLAWYDDFFFPVVAAIEEDRVLRGFPGRTAADLYLWIVRRLKELNGSGGGPLSIKSAVRSFSEKYGKSLDACGRALAACGRALAAFGRLFTRRR
jgi:hypothetical protein